jgi:hypothetical protein
MGSREDYAAKWKDPRWQKKRLLIFERDNFTCQLCRDKGTTLSVHHRYYIKGADPWDYLDDCLVTLCEPCHESETETRRLASDHMQWAMAKAGLWAHDVAYLASCLERTPRGCMSYEDQANMVQFIGLLFIRADIRETCLDVALQSYRGLHRVFASLHEKLAERGQG